MRSTDAALSCRRVWILLNKRLIEPGSSRRRLWISLFERKKKRATRAGASGTIAAAASAEQGMGNDNCCQCQGKPLQDAKENIPFPEKLQSKTEELCQKTFDKASNDFGDLDEKVAKAIASPMPKADLEDLNDLDESVAKVESLVPKAEQGFADQEEVSREADSGLVAMVEEETRLELLAKIEGNYRRTADSKFACSIHADQVIWARRYKAEPSVIAVIGEFSISAPDHKGEHHKAEYDEGACTLTWDDGEILEKRDNHVRFSVKQTVKRRTTVMAGSAG